MNLNHVKKKLRLTIFDLASSEGDARSRIILVHDKYLYSLRKSDFPISFQSEWKEINRMMKYKGKTSWNNAVRNTMLHSRNSSAKKIADKLIGLALRMRAIKI